MEQSAAQKKYTAAIIIIGNEILSGRTQDSNTLWIAERLNERGVILSEVRIIPDLAARIVDAVNEMRAQFDYVFTTGGIGPTHDDITAENIARAFEVKLERNEAAVQMLSDYYEEGDKALTPSRLKMAMIPEGATLIPNPVSGAPGFQMDNVYVMAGVPRIMHAMFEHVLETLVNGVPILSRTVVCQLSESEIAEGLSALQAAYADVQMGSYPHYRGGALGLSIVLRTVDLHRLDEATAALNVLLEEHGVQPQAISLKLPNE